MKHWDKPQRFKQAVRFLEGQSGLQREFHGSNGLIPQVTKSDHFLLVISLGEKMPEYG